MDNAEATPETVMLSRFTEIHAELCSLFAVAETYSEQHYLQEAIANLKKVIEITNLKQEDKEQ